VLAGLAHWVMPVSWRQLRDQGPLSPTSRLSIPRRAVPSMGVSPNRGFGHQVAGQQAGVRPPLLGPAPPIGLAAFRLTAHLEGGPDQLSAVEPGHARDWLGWFRPDLGSCYQSRSAVRAVQTPRPDQQVRVALVAVTRSTRPGLSPPAVHDAGPTNVLPFTRVTRPDRCGVAPTHQSARPIRPRCPSPARAKVWPSDPLPPPLPAPTRLEFPDHSGSGSLRLQSSAGPDRPTFQGGPTGRFRPAVGVDRVLTGPVLAPRLQSRPVRPEVLPPDSPQGFHPRGAGRRVSAPRPAQAEPPAESGHRRRYACRVLSQTGSFDLPTRRPDKAVPWQVPAAG